MREFMVLAFSLLVPPIVSFIKDCDWPPAAKYFTVLLVSLVMGAATAYVDGTLDLTNIAGTAGVIGLLAVGHYETWFKNTKLDNKLTGE